MLEQLFYNVLENSLRYSEPGSQVTIHAALRRSTLEVRIRDEGIGIPTADLERVFDRFYRASDRSSSEASGLGLAIAKGFTEAFGGKIWAELADDVAGGTIVNIEIPALARVDA
jgi:two-component system sensor histidine kinase KdpD